MIKVKKHKIKV